jgi:hypothetical protein
MTDIENSSPLLHVVAGAGWRIRALWPAPGAFFQICPAIEAKSESDCS